MEPLWTVRATNAPPRPRKPHTLRKRKRSRKLDRVSHKRQPQLHGAPDGRLPSPDHDLVFWSILEHMGQGAWRDLAHGSSSTGYAKEEGRSHLEDQLDRPLDQPVEFLNSTGQASTRSSWKSKSNPKNVASPLTSL
ncbi:unnamed protein product [Microthlaspi erraticum]|uniref:Uncharacterized protein n=1 Tax=Microthlaspi erraticum TaxID=1685480 RepID=A0A6D2JY72_9BRAS|nr:unnamed protein product [Microthlaspi erraticum]